MIEIEFHSPVGAPERYEPLYVTAFVEEELDYGELDPEAAASTAKALAIEGSETAQYIWAHMLLSGHGVPRDLTEAYRWFETAARGGNCDAQNMVGRCYELGWGVEADPTAAAAWYRSAAEKSHAWAQFNLASLLVRGDGVAQDYRSALLLLVRSARQKNAKAMNMLGRFREEGWGVPAKNRSAARWYRMAAERGCFRGQFHHARFLFADGKLGDAAGWLETSLAHAPTDFRHDAVQLLAQHPVAAFRQIAVVVFAGQGGGFPNQLRGTP